ncbi:MAG: universal stress protein [Anaerolineae bacterium]|nr:universal stress protein [Anaerolineae bacterium]
MQRPIVCATRGGQASRRTQEKAIALAKERGANLIFLCIADPSFAPLADDALEAALSDELTRLGRSMLYIAQARARKQGIEATAIVECGPVWDKIEGFLKDKNAQTLVIGAPEEDVMLQAFGAEKIHKFVERIEENTGVDVVVVT